MSQRSVLVTGGAGFIGSHVAEALLRRGDRVVVLDNFDDFYAPEIKWRNLAGVIDDPRMTVVSGDIRQHRDLDRAFATARYDAVIHLAARAGVRPSIADPELYADVNIMGTTRLLAQIRRHQVPQLVFGSSSSVYGSTTDVPFTEDRPADRPSSPYAATKRASELDCYTFHELYGTDVSCLRFFTVYGPRQRPEMAIHKFTRAIVAGESVPIFGDGSALRDFTHVTDIVAGVLAALDHPCGYRIYNLGTTAITRLGDLVSMLGTALRLPVRVRHTPPQAGDVPVTSADISRARRELGYLPVTPLKDGIDAFVAWFLAETGATAEAVAS